MTGHTLRKCSVTQNLKLSMQMVSRDRITYDDGTYEVPVTAIDCLLDDNNLCRPINMNKSKNWILLTDQLEKNCLITFISYNNYTNCFETVYKIPIIGYRIFFPINKFDHYFEGMADRNKVSKVDRNSLKYNTSQYFIWNGRYYDVNYIYSYNSELTNNFKIIGPLISPKINHVNLKNIIEIKQCTYYNSKHYRQIGCSINHDISHPQHYHRFGWIQANDLDYLEIKFLSARLITHIGTAGSYPRIDIFPKRRSVGRRKMRAYNLIEKDSKTSSYLKVIKSEESLSWVTCFELYYKHLVTNKWILIGTLQGNSDALTEYSNDLKLYYNCKDGLFTQCIRIKPLEYYIKPCMRVSIYGYDLSHHKTNECALNEAANQSQSSTIQYVISERCNHCISGKRRDGMKRLKGYTCRCNWCISYANNNRTKRKSEFRTFIKDSLN